MARLRSNFQRGSLSANISNVDTSIPAPEFATLPVVTAPDYLMIVLDPDAVHGNPEIVKVTAHTSSATTVTVTRAQEGTSARSHNSSTTWRHVTTKEDWEIVASGVIDVRAFGCKGDGSTDDAAARDQAFTAATNLGGAKIRFPGMTTSGTLAVYKLSTTCQIGADNIEVEIQAGATLQMSAAVPAFTVGNFTGGTGVTGGGTGTGSRIKHCTITGSGVIDGNNIGTIGIVSAGIKDLAVGPVKITRFTSHGAELCNYTVSAARSGDFSLTFGSGGRTKFQNNGGYAIKAHGDNNQCSFDIWAENNGAGGIFYDSDAWSGSVGLHFTGIIQNNTGHQVELYAGTTAWHIDYLYGELGTAASTETGTPSAEASTSRFVKLAAGGQVANGTISNSYCATQGGVATHAVQFAGTVLSVDFVENFFPGGGIGFATGVWTGTAPGVASHWGGIWYNGALIDPPTGWNGVGPTIHRAFSNFQIASDGSSSSSGAKSFGGLIGYHQYSPGSTADKTVTSNVLTAYDATNMTVSFVAPASGTVVVRLTGFIRLNTNGTVWALLDHTAHTIVGVVSMMLQGGAAGWNMTAVQQITGLSAGTTYQYDWAGCSTVVTTGSTTITAGGVTTTGGGSSPAVMEVFASP